MRAGVCVCVFYGLAFSSILRFGLFLHMCKTRNLLLREYTGEIGKSPFSLAHKKSLNSLCAYAYDSFIFVRNRARDEISTTSSANDGDYFWAKK